MLKKKSKLTFTVVLSLAFSVLAVVPAFALNYSGGGSGAGTGNKPFSFIGYECPNSTEIDLYFSKKSTTSGQINVSQFQLWNDTDTNKTNLVQSINVTDGTGTTGQYTDTTDSLVQNGTKVAITLSSALTGNAIYDMNIGGSVMNDNGITIGNYQNRNDLTFKFQEPAFSGGNPSWNSIPTLYQTYVVGNGTTNLSYESDTILIMSRPIATSSLSTFLGQLNATSTTGYKDTTSNTYVPNHEAYPAISNNAHNLSTVFYFPETKEGSGSNVYNRTSGTHSYTLTPGSYTDIANKTTTLSNLTFSTASSDYPGWETNSSTAGGTNAPITVTRSSNTVTVKFYDTWITPIPSSYDVYYIDSTTGNQYSPASKWTYLGNIPSSGTAGTLLSGQFTVGSSTYWYRAVPKNSTASVGFSLNNTSAI